MAEKPMASDDEKFEKLKTYNYKHNRVFQDGWRKVKAVVAQEMLFDSFVKAQVFFYSRYFYYPSIILFRVNKTWCSSETCCYCSGR